jgi:putative ABC transport system permease protein
MSSLFQDLKYGVRTLAKNLAFTAVAVLTLALGIGANTAIFTVVYGVLFQPLPYPDSERMVEITRTVRGRVADYNGFTASAFDFWKQHRTPFQDLAAFTGGGFSLTGAGTPERVRALRVSSEYFGVYGVEPFIGRSFSSDEDHVGGANVAVLSYSLWKAHFNGDPHALGQNVLLDGIPYTVIGVMPEGFESIPPASLWTKIEQVRRTIGSGQNYEVIGRLNPGVTQEKSTGYLGSLALSFIAENYSWMKESDRKVVSFAAAPYRYMISNDVRTPLLVLFGAIGFVLLTACVNVANLLLARTTARNREIALRSALGAGGARIVRQLLTESVLLALFGAAAGLLVAYWGLGSLLALAPADLPRASHIALNGWALVFTTGLAVLTGLLFGLAPAITVSRVNLNESLKEGEGRASRSHRGRLSAGLVSAEAALSLVLLIGSGLLIRTFANLLRTDPGFDPHHALALEIWTTGSKYNSTPALSSFYDEMIRRIRAVPGVESAAVVAAGLPLERGGNDNPGVRVGSELKHPSVDYREITPGYFRTLAIPMLQGRPFSDADTSSSPKVAIINAEFAHEFFKDQSPVGQHLFDDKPMEIVGVAGDVRSSMNEPAPPTYFVPMTQASFGTDQLFQGWFPTSILVRTSVSPLSLSHEIESAVRNAEPNLPIGRVRSMEEVLSTSLAFQRFLMTLMGVFAALALVLAAVGIYGVMSYWVRQRTREIGIRIALGAGRKTVHLWVVKQGMTLALYGIAAGLVAAFGLARLLGSVLYGVKPSDPLTFVAVSLVLAAVALAASYIPARRATKVDPMMALRYE